MEPKQKVWIKNDQVSASEPESASYTKNSKWNVCISTINNEYWKTIIEWRSLKLKLKWNLFTHIQLKNEITSQSSNHSHIHE